MTDKRIPELNALSLADITGSDLSLVWDVSASETKKVTVSDLLSAALSLVADGSIPSGKITFASGAIAAAALATDSVSTVKIQNDAVTAAKLANNSSVVVSATVPASGDFTGQICIDTDTQTAQYWNGSAWTDFAGNDAITTITGSSSEIVNITVTPSGNTVALSTTLDNTSAANQFLAGPVGGAGAPTYRTIAASDMPAATNATRGAVQVNGEGLRMDGSVIEIDNDVTAVTDLAAGAKVITYNAKGLVTGSRALTASDYPIATSSVVGVVRPGSGLSVDVDGTLNHSNTATPGTYTKVTVDSQGHVTTGATLTGADLPNHSAALLTSGTLGSGLFGTNSIAGTKLADYATVKFGGAGSTSGVVTFPTAEFAGQQFFDQTNGDLYLWTGTSWQPITVISGDLVYGGTYNAATNRVKSVTTQGAAVGLTVGAALPAASATNLRYYVVVSDSGTGVSPAPVVALAPPDMIVSNGATWDLVDVSNAIAGQIASNIAFTPYGDIVATNVQTALQELDDEKLPKAGGTVTGELLIGSTGTFAFEGSTANAYETYLACVDPTADRTITFPDQSGNVLVSGNASIVNADINASAAIAYSKLSLSGSIVNADIASGAAIADTKLATISSAGKVSNSATTATNANTASAIVARDASGNFSAGTITAALTGNASTATALATARNIQGVAFDGTANITVVTAGSGISVTGTAVANTGVLSVNGNTGAITNVAVTNTAQSFTAAQRGSVSALTSASTVTPDFSLSNNWSLGLAHNVTLANPTNLTAGQSGAITITQGSSTAYTLSFGGNWKFSGGTPTMSTGLSSVSVLVYYVESSSRITAQLITNVT